jgi:hypothetical protein
MLSGGYLNGSFNKIKSIEEKPIIKEYDGHYLLLEKDKYDYVNIFYKFKINKKWLKIPNNKIKRYNGYIYIIDKTRFYKQSDMKIELITME